MKIFIELSENKITGNELFLFRPIYYNTFDFGIMDNALNKCYIELLDKSNSKFIDIQYKYKAIQYILNSQHREISDFWIALNDILVKHQYNVGDNFYELIISDYTQDGLNVTLEEFLIKYEEEKSDIIERLSDDALMLFVQNETIKYIETIYDKYFAIDILK